MRETEQIQPDRRGYMMSIRILFILALLGASLGGRPAKAQAAPPVQAAGQEGADSPPPYPQAPDVGPQQRLKPSPVGQVEDTERPTRPRPEPPSEPASEPPSVSTSYGGQIVLADLGAILVGSIATGTSGSGAPILLMWSFASPVVHAVHGHPGRAAGSVLLHVGLPILGGALGVALESCGGGGEYDLCGLEGLLAGGLLGMVAATTIDAAVLAQSSDLPPGRLAHARGPASAPILSVGRNGNVAMGWRGTF
jgi:hypothetical protein